MSSISNSVLNLAEEVVYRRGLTSLTGKALVPDFDKIDTVKKLFENRDTVEPKQLATCAFEAHLVPTDKMKSFSVPQGEEQFYQKIFTVHLMKNLPEFYERNQILTAPTAIFLKALSAATCELEAMKKHTFKVLLTNDQLLTEEMINDLVKLHYTGWISEMTVWATLPEGQEYLEEQAAQSLINWRFSHSG